MSSLCIGLLITYSKVHAQVSYQRADSIAEHYAGASLDNLYQLAHQLTDSLPTETEKFRALYTWVVQNLKNDGQLYERTLRTRKRLANDPEALLAWNQRWRSRMWDRLRTKQKTICTGYAYLLSHLAEEIGITCEPVIGYSRSGQRNVSGEKIINHHWNAINLDGQWHLCDPTWSSGLYRLWSKATWQDPYFLLDPELFLLNHYPVDTAWLLVEAAPSLDEFLASVLVYPAAQREGLMPQSRMPFALNAEVNQPITISFAQYRQEPLASLKLEWVHRSGENREYRVAVQDTDQGLSEVSFRLPKSGAYTVHLRQGREYLFTYEVIVE